MPKQQEKTVKKQEKKNITSNKKEIKKMDKDSSTRKASTNTKKKPNTNTSTKITKNSKKEIIPKSTSQKKTTTKTEKNTKQVTKEILALSIHTTKPLKTTAMTPSNPAASNLAKKMTIPFEIGDYIFYPNEGLGHIIGTEDIVLENELTPYYVIRFTAQKMTNRIPIKNYKKVKLRKLINKTTANNVLKKLLIAPPKNDLSWKDRLLVYQKINSKGNSLEMSEMLVALYLRKQIRTTLSFQERQIFDFTLEALSNEIAKVLHISNDQATKEIINRLTETYKNTISTENTS